MLRLQQYIELVRSQTQQKEAINHARKHLLPFKDTHPNEVLKACGLLAFPPSLLVHSNSNSYSNSNSPSSISRSDLYAPNRWELLADLFTETHNALLTLPSIPLLHIALSSGLSALKTPACHTHVSTSPSSSGLGSASPLRTALAGQSVCPICSTELNELARCVPYAHHDKSHVEHDLLVLPNRRVYSRERLEDFARKAGLPDYRFKDLRTGELFDVDDAKKVYIT
jgi:macrophage erythroblast attacher